MKKGNRITIYKSNLMYTKQYIYASFGASIEFMFIFDKSFHHHFDNETKFNEVVNQINDDKIDKIIINLSDD